ncbi:NUDIX hydrolase [Candidatus Saccharibacteria bacterium]|nr:NUDIX hydrolase [Candidatus Saccharibacteria bacterium]
MTVTAHDKTHDGELYELFQVSAKAVLFNVVKDKVLLLLHDDGDHSIPGGHIEPGESLQEALLRELNEELGFSYHGSLWLVKADKYQTQQTKASKIDLYYVGELDENAPISIKNNGDGLVGWEWVAVDSILDGSYKCEPWIPELLKEALR